MLVNRPHPSRRRDQLRRSLSLSVPTWIVSDTAWLCSSLADMTSFEASITPAFVLIVSMWYRRNEQAGRMSLFLAANGLATIICSPVAYGLSGLVNPAIESWRVLYILVCGQKAFEVQYMTDYLSSASLPLSPVSFTLMPFPTLS